jgi:predicted Rossmann fold nucleotide-binding protein DprA/Smf involved in DNA uptake
MSISPNTQAILLLTAHFSKASDKAVRPLTPTEWGRFAKWLKNNKIIPEQLLTGKPEELLREWVDKKITLERVSTLLNRGSALALAMDKWLRSGLWVMTRSDSDYPSRLKSHLKTDSPALLFGCGNRALLNGGGLAVIGSRKTSDEDLTFSRKLGALASESGHSIISGGAKGVDEAAMLGTLENEGTAVGVLADSLLRASTSAKYRSYLMANSLALISPFYPEAGFNVGNAMARNRYIYCLSDAALAVHSGPKGGTWSGAQDNLKKQWVPLWVKKTTDQKSGNAAIVQSGAAWVSDNIKEINFSALLKAKTTDTNPEQNLFSTVDSHQINDKTPTLSKPLPQSPPQSDSDYKENGHNLPMAQNKNNSITLATEAPISVSISFYDLFLLKAQALCSIGPKTIDELVEAMDLTNKTQLAIWLKRAVADGKIAKLTKPVRYEWVTVRQASLPI